MLSHIVSEAESYQIKITYHQRTSDDVRSCWGPGGGGQFKVVWGEKEGIEKQVFNVVLLLHLFAFF